MRSLRGLGASWGEGVGMTSSLCLDLCVFVWQGLEELWQGSRHCPVCTSPTISTPPAQTECCRGRGGLAGSWGTLPPLLRQEHQPWEPLWQGSPSTGTQGPPKSLAATPYHQHPLLPLVSPSTSTPPTLMWGWGPGKDFKFMARPPIELTVWLFAQFGSLFRAVLEEGVLRTGWKTVGVLLAGTPKHCDSYSFSRVRERVKRNEGGGHK